jgi:hypothetical protein
MKTLARKFPPNGTRVSAILEELGVSFKKPVGYFNTSAIQRSRSLGFWQRNEGDLENILYDFRRKARELKSRLHPDRGGDAKLFAQFSAKCDLIERRFARRLNPWRTN